MALAPYLRWLYDALHAKAHQGSDGGNSTTPEDGGTVEIM